MYPATGEHDQVNPTQTSVCSVYQLEEKNTKANINKNWKHLLRGVSGIANENLQSDSRLQFTPSSFILSAMI